MDNGDKPAFTKLDHRQPPHPQIAKGLTKREYFAGLAMGGMNMYWDGAYSPQDRQARKPDIDAAWVATAAVRHADALLKALEE